MICGAFTIVPSGPNLAGRIVTVYVRASQGWIFIILVYDTTGDGSRFGMWVLKCGFCVGVRS